jgi:hypothetical protein
MAQVWYQQRVTTQTTNNFTDTWTSFVSAMEQKYLNTHEVAEKHRAMFNLCYKGDVRDYIHQMQNLNSIVNIQDITYIEALRKNLPEYIEQAMMYRGPDPEEAILYEAKLEEVGRLLEDHDRKKKRGNQPTIPGNEKTGGKRKRGKGNKDSSNADEPKPKKQDVGSKKSDWVKGTPPKYKAEQRAERTSGLQQTQIDSRTKNGLCITCGESGHRWQWCPNAIRTSSIRKISSVKKSKGKKEKSKSEDSAPATTTAAVSSVKREPPKHTVGPGVLDKTPQERILADLKQKAGVITPSATVSVSAIHGTSEETSLKSRIWEVDSENEF